MRAEGEVEAGSCACALLGGIGLWGQPMTRDDNGPIAIDEHKASSAEVDGRDAIKFPHRKGALPRGGEGGHIRHAL